MSADLLTQVRRGLKTSRVPLLHLAKEANVPYSWLCMFHRGKIADPGILKIERLAKHFADNERAPKKLPLSRRSTDRAVA